MSPLKKVAQYGCTSSKQEVFCTNQGTWACVNARAFLYAISVFLWRGAAGASGVVLAGEVRQAIGRPEAARAGACADSDMFRHREREFRQRERDTAICQPEAPYVGRAPDTLWPYVVALVPAWARAHSPSVLDALVRESTCFVAV